VGLTARQQRVFDKEPSIQKAHKKAVQMHEKGVRGQKTKKKNWAKKLKRSVRELIGGRKTYLKKGGK
jgi:hypothetical protein